jgi:argonaute-like protein implicated in RNA metabolism and viral defense
MSQLDKFINYMVKHYIPNKNELLSLWDTIKNDTCIKCSARELCSVHLLKCSVKTCKLVCESGKDTCKKHSTNYCPILLQSGVNKHKPCNKPCKNETCKSHQHAKMCSIKQCKKTSEPNTVLCINHRKEEQLKKINETPKIILRYYNFYYLIHNTQVVFDPIHNVSIGYITKDGICYERNDEVNVVCRKFNVTFKYEK